MTLKSKDDFGSPPHHKRKDAHEERREREAWALAIVKAMRRSPSAPPPEMPPWPPTHLEGSDPNAPGVVYFAYCGGRIKIGYSTDHDKRIGQYATHAPMPVTLLLTIRGCEKDEDGYHKIFAEERVNLEWFRLSARLRLFLESKFKFDTSVLLMKAEFEAYEDMRESSAYMRGLIKDLKEELEDARNAD